MRKFLPLILGLLCFAGCVHQPRIAQLSEKQRRDLVIAVNDWASSPHARPDWPDEIRRLRPLAVYWHSVNLAIVLSRDGRQERGFYVVPVVSSYSPNPSAPEWKWKWIPAGPSLWQGSLYEYVRTYSSSWTRLKAYIRKATGHYNISETSIAFCVRGAAAVFPALAVCAILFV